jgi:hypothetical protein
MPGVFLIAKVSELLYYVYNRNKLKGAVYMDDLNLRIEYVPIDSIKAYSRNAKLHPPEQIEQIKESIRQVGFRDPIGIWHGEIVEGHGRHIAAKELGMETVPVIKLDDMTDEERRAYMLIHNQTTMNSGWDFTLLEEEISGLDMDMSAFGFDFGGVETEANDSGSVGITDSISVVIDCENEIDAERIYNTLTEEGYKCRISTL